MPSCPMRTLPFSTPSDAMLTMFVRTIHWLSMHLYTVAHMSMHESCLLVCRLCFNTMKLWAFDPNLHLSPVDTTFCLLFRLFAFLLVCFLPGFFAYHAYHAFPLYAFPYALCIFSFHCFSTGFLSLSLHVHTMSEDGWSYGTVS